MGPMRRCPGLSQGDPCLPAEQSPAATLGMLQPLPSSAACAGSASSGNPGEKVNEFSN